MRLSVCVITYNHERLIEQALRSVLAQETRFGFEVVVGDDLSTDGTSARVASMVAEFPGRIRAVTNPRNLGAHSNFMESVARCTGEYVAFLEGDDFWTARHKLQRQVEFLDAHPQAAFCFHRARSLSEGVDETYLIPGTDLEPLSSIAVLLAASNPVAFGSIVVRRSLLADVPAWFGELKFSDWPLCMFLATKGLVGYLAEEMSRYRVHPGGTWTRRGPLLRVAYEIQMWRRMSGTLLAGEAARFASGQAERLADWWCGQISHDTSLAPEPLLTEIAALDDHGLSTFLLARMTTFARAQEAHRLWATGQAEAWRAVAQGGAS